MNIPDDHWTGAHTLRLGLPWLTPGSIEWLDANLTPAMRVLEFGGGGSTVFFASRCLSVASFETNCDWQRRTHRALQERGLEGNVFQARADGRQWPDLHKDWHAALEHFNGEYDVAVVDSVSDRTELCRWIVELQLMKPRAVVVLLDNYSRPEYAAVDGMFEGWEVMCFDDPHWSGSGTKIYTRGWV